MSSTRLRSSNITPKQAGISIAMTAISNATARIDEQVDDSDLPLTQTQRKGIVTELEKIHKRIGKSLPD